MKHWREDKRNHRVNLLSSGLFFISVLQVLQFSHRWAIGLSSKDSFGVLQGWNEFVGISSSHDGDLEKYLQVLDEIDTVSSPWVYVQKIFLQRAKNCDYFLKTLISESEYSFFHKYPWIGTFLKPFFASRRGGKILYLGDESNGREAFVHLLEKVSENVDCIPLSKIWNLVSLDTWSGLESDLGDAHKSPKDGFELVLVDMPRNWLSNQSSNGTLDFYPYLKSSGFIILMGTADMSYGHLMDLMVPYYNTAKGNAAQHIFVKLTESPSFSEIWDALMMLSVEVMYVSKWENIQMDLGNIADFRVKLGDVLDLVQTYSKIEHVCEIGFHWGHTALAILSSRSDITLTSFDIGRFQGAKEIAENLKARFANRYEHIQGPSQQTVSRYARDDTMTRCDLFIVNGNHSYQEVSSDFDNALQAMSDGALLFADGYSTSNKAVVRAWKEIERYGFITTFRSKRLREKYHGTYQGWCVGKMTGNSSMESTSSSISLEAATFLTHEINVAMTQCGFDPSSLLELDTLIKSIIVSSLPDEVIHIHLIADDQVPQAFLKKLKEMMRLSGNRLTLYKPGLLEQGIVLFRPCAMDRLMLPSLVDRRIDRIIYLDRDTLVLKSLKSLYQTNFKDELLGIVPEGGIWYPTKQGVYNAGITYPERTGVNSGVLLMNLKQMRSTNFSRQLLDLVHTAPYTELGDQDLINYYFAKRLNSLIFLECKYNMRLDGNRIECDCGSLRNTGKKIESIDSCARHSQLDDAVIIHGNRFSFRSDENILSLIWRQLLSIRASQRHTKLVSFPALPSDNHDDIVDQVRGLRSYTQEYIPDENDLTSTYYIDSSNPEF
eukprot:jgi/Picsp_1/2559/NSC_00790-R1_glt8d3 protein